MIVAALLTIVGLFISGLLLVLWWVSKSAVTQEASNVLPDATRSLVDRAMNRLPEDARRRYEEEWPAGFEEAIEKRPIWAFREAVSLYRGARRIARALEPTPAVRGRGRVGLAADSAVAGATGILGRFQRLLNRLSSSVDRIVDPFEPIVRRFCRLAGFGDRVTRPLVRTLAALVVLSALLGPIFSAVTLISSLLSGA